MASKIIEIDFEGNPVPIAVGYYALKRFKQERGYEFEESKEGNELDDLEVLFWYSVEAGFKHKKRQNPEYPDNPYSRDDDLELMLDSCLIEFSKSIPSFFQIPEATPKTSGPQKPKKTTSEKATSKK